MRIFCDIIGIGCYCLALYFAFIENPNDYESLFRRASTNGVMNQQFAFLGAILISVIGTGFLVIGSRYNPTKIDDIADSIDGPRELNN